MIRAVGCLLLFLPVCLGGCNGRTGDEATSRSGDDSQSSSTRPLSGTVAPATAFQPSDAVVESHNRAVALMGYFDYDGAYAVLEELATANPQWAAVRVDWAIAALNRRQEGDSERAARLLEGVLEQDPTNLRAHYCLGILSLDAGEPARALKHFEIVARDDPRDGYGLYYTGQCHAQSGQIEQALQRYLVAMKCDPYLRSCYYGAFQASAQLGKRDQSLEFLEQFKRLEGNPQARLAEIKYTRMGPKATLHAFDTVDSKPPQVPDGPLFAPATVVEDRTGAALPWAEEPAAARHVSVADLWSDGRLTAVFAGAGSDVSRPNLVLRQADDGGWDALPEHPLAAISEVTAVVWGDYDNDGYVDAYFCRNGFNQLWRQVGEDVWQDVTESTNTAGADLRTLDGQMFDADHDGDLDLLLMNDGPNELLSNNLDGTFRPLAAERGLAGSGGRSTSAIVLDIDSDRDLDFLVLNEVGPNELYLNDRLWAYQSVSAGAASSATEPLQNDYTALIETLIQAAVPVDIETDGQPELVIVAAEGLQILAVDKNGVWNARPLAIEGVDATSLPSRLSIADVDGDAALDLLVATRDGFVVARLPDGATMYQDRGGQLVAGTLAHLNPELGPTLLAVRDSRGYQWNPDAGRFSFLGMAFTGKEEKADQMRSNRGGIGVDASARLGRLWTSLRTLRCDSGPGQNLQPLAVGLAGKERLDYVRLVWPDGVFQTEVDLRQGQLYRIAETQRQVASCPVVFVWNGSEYAFVTDVLGIGGIGFNVADGEYGEPRPWENLLLPPALAQPHDGRIRIKVGEPMEEVCYLDAARLVAYDLPPGCQMTIDERFAINGPPPTGKPIFYDQLRLPVAASNDRGKSVLEAIETADLVAADPGRRDPRFIGRTEPHWVEIEFKRPINGDATYLLFDGWIEYPYSQTMFAAWQAKATFDAPSLEAFNEQTGEWQTIIEQFGYMAGMPRQAVVPLPPERVPENTRRLRLRSNIEIYWDRIAVIHGQTRDDVGRYELPLSKATVDAVGFAKRTTSADQRLPNYDYRQRSPLWDTRHPRGNYSRFGDALELVAGIDDTLAIIGPGEEVHLEFETGTLPASTRGKRQLVLELTVGAKTWTFTPAKVKLSSRCRRVPAEVWMLNSVNVATGCIERITFATSTDIETVKV